MSTSSRSDQPPGVMMPSSTVLITGVAGQDGTLLARQGSSRGWATWGVVGLDTSRADQDMLAELPGMSLVEADLSDLDTCRRVIADIRPDIVFHLAAISSVGRSWDDPLDTAQINAMATLALMAESLELTSHGGHDVRFVNASSGEIFAGTEDVPQSERTALAPLSPYGASKAFAHMMATVFRARGLRASNAILYNHESPLRPKTFVTRKITSGVAAIVAGTQQTLRLGNLDARRDWGWAPDYVECLIRIALHDKADDFVVATGESHSVRDFVSVAFGAAGIKDWYSNVEIDTSLVRPADSVELVGDASKARSELNWRPTKTFDQIVAAMVHHDLDVLKGHELSTQDPAPGRTG
jgi:GDPmannose 4,6-dehydratase